MKSEGTNGKRLQAAREAAGMTQRELAEKAGYSDKYISMLEKGKRRLDWDKAHRFAGVLSVPAAYLMGESGFASVDDRVAYLMGKDEETAKLNKIYEERTGRKLINEPRIPKHARALLPFVSRINGIVGAWYLLNNTSDIDKIGWEIGFQYRGEEYHIPPEISADICKEISDYVRFRLMGILSDSKDDLLMKGADLTDSKWGDYIKYPSRDGKIDLAGIHFDILQYSKDEKAKMAAVEWLKLYGFLPSGKDKKGGAENGKRQKKRK